MKAKKKKKSGNLKCKYFLDILSHGRGRATWFNQNFIR